MEPRVTVIIPTTAVSERRDYLARSIDSVLTQTSVNVSALIVANGGRCDDALLSKLSRTKNVTVIRFTEESLPVALRTGRKYVETPFFGELDDDDVLLPRGLDNLSAGFRRDPEAHVIVGNGYLRRDGFSDIESMTDIDLLRANPLRALLQRNWLYPGGALFRSDAVSERDFSHIAKYYEWTYLAVVLCLTHKVSFVSSPVFIHHIGLPLSMDVSREALFGRIEALRTILSLPMPSDIRRGFRRKLGAQFHGCSAACLDERRNLGAAFTHHLSSLTYPGGWRYLSYTRHLLYAALTDPLRL